MRSMHRNNLRHKDLRLYHASGSRFTRAAILLFDNAPARHGPRPGDNKTRRPTESGVPAASQR